MRRLSLAALLSSLVVVNVAAQASAPQSLIPRFEAAPCPFELNARVSGQVRCGYVTVPENRSKPDGRRLRLVVAILKSFSGTPRPDPVVRLAGGPGEPLVARALSVVSDTSDASELIETLRSERDVILYDRAGVVRGATGMPRCVPRRRAGLWANDSRAGTQSLDTAGPRQHRHHHRCNLHGPAAGRDEDAARSRHDPTPRPRHEHTQRGCAQCAGRA